MKRWVEKRVKAGYFQALLLLGENELKLPEGKYAMSISQKLLEILVCPRCKGAVELNPAKDGLICKACRLVYEVRDDIPIMLVDQARPLDAGSRH